MWIVRNLQTTQSHWLFCEGGGLLNRTYYKGPVRGGVVLGGRAFDQQRVLCHTVLKFQEPRGVDGAIVFLFFLLLLLLVGLPPLQPLNPAEPPPRFSTVGWDAIENERGACPAKAERIFFSGFCFCPNKGLSGFARSSCLSPLFLFFWGVNCN